MARRSPCSSQALPRLHHPLLQFRPRRHHRQLRLRPSPASLLAGQHRAGPHGQRRRPHLAPMTCAALLAGSRRTRRRWVLVPLLVPATVSCPIRSRCAHPRRPRPSRSLGRRHRARPWTSTMRGPAFAASLRPPGYHPIPQAAALPPPLKPTLFQPQTPTHQPHQPPHPLMHHHYRAPSATASACPPAARATPTRHEIFPSSMPRSQVSASRRVAPTRPDLRRAPLQPPT